jgi:hypothetical protein
MIKLEATYSKKLGLPNFSSHCYVVSLTAELTDLSQVEAESAKLYAMLQHTVDRELQEPGFLPESPSPASNGSGHSRNGSNGSHGRAALNGSNGRAQYRPTQGASNGTAKEWACSEKQRALITRIVTENTLPPEEVDSLAEQLFGIPAEQCNKMQASQLIEDLLEKVGKGNNGRSRWRQPARQ